MPHRGFRRAIEDALAGRAEPRLWMAEALDFFHGARFSPDGRWIAYYKNETAELEEATRISVVLNWFEELERAFGGATR